MTDRDVFRFRELLAEGDDRPFRDYYWYEMASVVNESSDDVFTLRALVLEAALRVSKNPSSNSEGSCIAQEGA